MDPLGVGHPRLRAPGPDPAWWPQSLLSPLARFQPSLLLRPLLYPPQPGSPLPSDPPPPTRNEASSSEDSQGLPTLMMNKHQGWFPECHHTLGQLQVLRAGKDTPRQWSFSPGYRCRGLSILSPGHHHTAQTRASMPFVLLDNLGRH